MKAVDSNTSDSGQPDVELKRPAELLKMFMAHTPAAAAMCDTKMRYLAYSRRWSEDYGLGDDNLVGRCHYDLFPDLPEHWKDEHKRCFSEEKYRNLFETAMVGLYRSRIDDGKILAANQAFAEIMGYDSPDQFYKDFKTTEHDVNAWQAMPAGETLFIRTENIQLDNNFVKPYNAVPGDYVNVSIKDTGVGIDASTLKKVFDPFFTTKEQERGTGLGLASADGIVKNHDGIIVALSEKGKGATFNIYLPASG